MSYVLENIDEIEEIIIAYANGELHRRLEITGARDYRDALIAGINMLGEELEKTTISKDYFMNIYHSVSEILIITDIEGKIVDMNLAAEKTLNKTILELNHTDIRHLISRRFLGLQDKIIDTFNSGNMFASFEAALCHPLSEIPISCTLTKIIDRSFNHKGYIFIAKDITAQKSKEISDLKIVISTQEKERKRLAYDLHDSLGQEMNAIKMYINSLAAMDRSSDSYKHAFETCKQIVDHSIESIRNISFDLMPKSLEKGGLVEALNELVTKLNIVREIKYNYPEFTLALDKENEIILYRIVQEFINNSLKHTKNCNIEIHLTNDRNLVQLSMKDDGNGFNFDGVKQGNGIYNLKTRLNALGANYTFESTINKGTYLNLTLEI